MRQKHEEAHAGAVKTLTLVLRSENQAEVSKLAAAYINPAL